MEEEVCDHLRKMPAHKITDGFKQKLISSSSVALLPMKMSFSIGASCQQMQMKRMPRPYWKWWLSYGLQSAALHLPAPGLKCINKPPTKQSRDRRLCVGIYKTLVLPLSDPALLLYLHAPWLMNLKWHTCSNRSNVVQLRVWLVQLSFSPRQRSVLFLHV